MWCPLGIACKDYPEFGIILLNDAPFLAGHSTEGIVLAAAGISSLLIAGSVGYYAQVKLPPLARTSNLFPIVRSLLYFCMGISAYWIQNSGATSLMKQTAFFWYGLQLFVNVLWPVFFFLFRFYGFSFIWVERCTIFGGSFNRFGCKLYMVCFRYGGADSG